MNLIQKKNTVTSSIIIFFCIGLQLSLLLTTCPFFSIAAIFDHCFKKKKTFNSNHFSVSLRLSHIFTSKHTQTCVHPGFTEADDDGVSALTLWMKCSHHCSYHPLWKAAELGSASQTMWLHTNIAPKAHLVSHFSLPPLSRWIISLSPVLQYFTKCKTLELHIGP